MAAAVITQHTTKQSAAKADVASERNAIAQGPLAGLRVVEVGSLIAGPFCAKLLGDFGAEVIKVEPPGTGDGLRTWRTMRGDTSLWWQMQSANKKSVTLDLRNHEGQAALKRLIATADVLVENFRPGTLEKWGLAPDSLLELNSRLVIVRVSGYGQTGPYREKPGFASVAEAIGGLRYLTGFPDRPPVRANLSLGDTLAAMWGMIGALLSLLHVARSGGKGQVVDVALYEAVLGITESMLTEYDAAQVQRERAGSALPGVVPSNLYRCADGSYIVIAGNSDGMFQRLMTLIGRADLADDSELANNAGRVAATEVIDGAIGAWAAQHHPAEAIKLLERADVTASPIYTAADMLSDPHFAVRGMLQRITTAEGDSVCVPGVVPKLSRTPGAIRHRAPTLGEHTQEVLLQAGFSQAEFERLKAGGVV